MLSFSVSFLLLLFGYVAAEEGAQVVLPESKGYVKLDGPYTVKAGSTFDGGMKTFDIGHTCEEQKETGSKYAAFLLEQNATLKNVIIGKAQNEGVHCMQSSCTLINVWWEDVCEDALTINESGGEPGVVQVIGGGAFNAEDKIIQDNGFGETTIKDFYAENFGKLWKVNSFCMKGKSRIGRLSNITAKNGKILATMPDCKGTGGEVHISNVTLIGVGDICWRMEGSFTDNDDGDTISHDTFDGKVCIKDGPISRSGEYDMKKQIEVSNASGKNYESGNDQELEGKKDDNKDD